MQINSVQSYNINEINSKQSNKNPSFGHITANVNKDFTNVRRMLSDVKFNSYVRHFNYLQKFKLNLKQIMKNVDVIKYFPFNKIYPNLSKEQINNCAQMAIDSFVKVLGAKARDFSMKFEPHPAKTVYPSTDYDNVFYGCGLADNLKNNDIEAVEITPQTLSKDKVKF